MRTKVFQSGNSQAIRIPKELRLDCNEVEIEKIDDKIVISPVNEKSWDEIFQSLKELGGVDLDIQDLPLQERDLF